MTSESAQRELTRILILAGMSALSQRPLLLSVIPRSVADDLQKVKSPIGQLVSDIDYLCEHHATTTSDLLTCYVQQAIRLADSRFRPMLRKHLHELQGALMTEREPETSTSTKIGADATEIDRVDQDVNLESRSGKAPYAIGVAAAILVSVSAWAIFGQRDMPAVSNVCPPHSDLVVEDKVASRCGGEGDVTIKDSQGNVEGLCVKNGERIYYCKARAICERYGVAEITHAGVKCNRPH